MIILILIYPIYLDQRILINDVSDMVGRHTNLNLLNRCFEKLFEKILD